VAVVGDVLPSRAVQPGRGGHGRPAGAPAGGVPRGPLRRHLHRTTGPQGHRRGLHRQAAAEKGNPHTLSLARPSAWPPVLTYQQMT